MSHFLPSSNQQDERELPEFEMIPLNRYEVPESGALNETGPSASLPVSSKTARISELFRKTPIAIGTITIISFISFISGSYFSVEGSGVSVCAGQQAAENILGDSVAPEGPVSSSFYATHDYRGKPRSIKSYNGAVSADHGRCSDIGLAALQKGGNAVDSAVAVALCQGVLNPMASGIGGGMIMLIRLPNGTAEVIDAREVAPLAANETMFKGHPELSLYGGLAIGIPLELRGLQLAHERHGSLPWQSLVEPAAEIASEGFPAHPYLVSALEAANFTSYPELQSTFLVPDMHANGGWRAPKVNETCCRRPQLAKLFQDVAKGGADVLYTGDYAAGLAADIQESGGIITEDDLHSAYATVKEPIRAHVMGADFIAPPPPSSAATVIAALQVLSGYDLPLAGSGVVGVHRLVEAMKHAFALRMSLGDPGPDPDVPFVPELKDVLSDMLSPEYTESLRLVLDDYSVLNLSQYGGKWNVLKGGAHPEDHGTSHMNVVDATRLTVSLTTTINAGFGSKVLSRSTGILLNNQMDDFSTPGHPNLYGIPPSPSNFIRPGKKPFSSMSPLVMERDGELRLVLGASGGPRIISAVIQTLIRIISYGEDAFSAVAGPRLHHQLVPTTVYAESWGAGEASFAYQNATLEGLAERGHEIVPSAWGAVVQAVVADADAEPGVEFPALIAVSDPRKDGAPAGY